MARAREVVEREGAVEEVKAQEKAMAAAAGMVEAE